MTNTTIETRDLDRAQVAPDLALNPFRAHELYRVAGWLGTLPIPYKEKKFPPSGFTGETGKFPTDAQCAAWLDEYKAANIALRVPEGLVGIDIDQYVKDGKQKRGADNLRAMAEREGLSPLPATWSSTRRDPDGPARIRWFRIPKGIKFDGQPVEDVEIVQHGHRYAMVWPSVVAGDEPGEWTQYAWYDPEGAEATHVPPPDGMPWLPADWVEALREVDHRPSQASTPTSGGKVTGGLAELLALAADDPGRNNAWLTKVAGHLARLHEDDRGTYDARLGEADQASDRPHSLTAFRKTADSVWKTHQKNRETRKVTSKAESPETANPGWGYPIQLKDGASNIRNLRAALNDGAIPDVYVQNGQLVKLYDDFGNVELPQGESQKALAPFTNDAFGNEVADHIFFYQEVKDEDSGEYKMRPKQPRQETLRTVLGNRSWPGVPPLRGITRVPILRTDGTILNEAGYDSASGMYLDPMCEFDQVPERPTRDEVDYAFDFIYNKVLGGFPYASQADRANAFAYATHAAGRRFLEGVSDGGVQPTPGANITAGSQGTGKSYLANVVRWTSGGIMTDYRPDETELSKTIVSSLFNKYGSVVILDNVPDGYMVKNTTLANFLTNGLPDARLLGATKNIRMINDMFWVLTGNGTRLSDDNRRRFFDIRLDAKVANPAMRDNFVLGDLESFFKRNRRNRAKYVWCCLVLWRAWIVAGADEATPAMRGSYGWWSRPTAGFLEFLGIEGFMDNYDPGASAEADHWVPFLSAWFAKYSTKRLKVGQLMKDHIDNGERDGWDGSFMLPINANDYQDVRKAGDILSGKIDKVWSNGLVLKSAKRSGSNTYWVEKTES
ncbi:bifunctional DNA primase/polymerase [Streptomyces sp. NPDC051639]|uniref:bifunctional DNA primase/polymerase n=1 Tax=Streptomyces sp. NPDC051639 TaxID=3155671 RepID=UPI003429CCA7